METVIEKRDSSLSDQDALVYTRHHMKHVLQLMGVKPLHAHEMSYNIFTCLFEESQHNSSFEDAFSGAESWRKNENAVMVAHDKEMDVCKLESHFSVEEGSIVGKGTSEQDRINILSEALMRHSGIKAKLIKEGMPVVSFARLFSVVRDCMAMYQYSYQGKNLLKDFQIACAVRDRKRSITVLFGGTSGCGKSTLASLVASRLGITTVISTDNIRHVLRNTVSQEKCPVLFTSTYNTSQITETLATTKTTTKPPHDIDEVARLTDIDMGGLTAREYRVLGGYERQNSMLFDKIESLISSFEERGESVVVEGVHLCMDYIIELMKRHRSCIPFLIYISNPTKHKERFAVRAKYMAVDSRSNKYTKFFSNIRLIQAYLVSRAERRLIPRIDNTNIDRSLAVIQSTIFNCLRAQSNGQKMLNDKHGTAKVVSRCYEDTVAKVWGSKTMLKLIRKRRSRTRRLDGGGSDNETEVAERQIRRHSKIASSSTEDPDSPVASPPHLSKEITTEFRPVLYDATVDIESERTDPIPSDEINQFAKDDTYLVLLTDLDAEVTRRSVSAGPVGLPNLSLGVSK